MHHVSPDSGRAPAPCCRRPSCCWRSACSPAGAQALMVPMDDAALATGADEVVRGEITAVSSQWNADHTTSSPRPSVRVKGRAKGAGPDTLALTVPGGTVDGITEWVEDEPVLVNGTEAFVFVSHGPKGNRVYGGSQGIVPVEQGRVRGNGKTKGGGVPADAYGQYLGALAAGRAAAPPAAEPAPRAAAGTVPVITGVSPAAGSARDRDVDHDHGHGLREPVVVRGRRVRVPVRRVDGHADLGLGVPVPRLGTTTTSSPGPTPRSSCGSRPG